MPRRLFFSSLLTGVLATGVVALAHHSTAAYQTKTTTLKRAVVKKFACRIRIASWRLTRETIEGG